MKQNRSTKAAASGPAPSSSTVVKILNCAEKEFAARGYEGTPLQRIAKGAKVNQALINYHFGSKEKLYQAVFLRRGSELTRERLRLLDELESRTSGRPTVEDLVRCFLVPAITMGYEGSDGRNFLKLQARLHSEPKEITGKLRRIIYDQATLRYIESFKAALPQIDPKAIVWRVTMMIGAYLYIVSDASRLEQLSNGSCNINDHDEVMRQLSAFLTAGFKGPLP
jgi:AcrR family transcriptional regulator